MPIKITQALVDQAYGMLKTLMKTKKIQTLTPESFEIILSGAVFITHELLDAKTRHAYLIELATAIVRKVIDDPEITSPELRDVFHIMLEGNILTLLPKLSCWQTFCACSK